MRKLPNCGKRRTPVAGSIGLPRKRNGMLSYSIDTASRLRPSQLVASQEKPSEAWVASGVASVELATSLGGGTEAPGSWFVGSGWPGRKKVPSELRMPEELVLL